jgi:hypothetical protein
VPEQERRAKNSGREKTKKMGNYSQHSGLMSELKWKKSGSIRLRFEHSGA